MSTLLNYSGEINSKQELHANPEVLPVAAESHMLLMLCMLFGPVTLTLFGLPCGLNEDFSSGLIGS